MTTKKILKSAYENEPLNIVGMKIDCAVLEDNTRVISQSGINSALERPEGGYGSGSGKLPSFLGLNALKPFIDKGLSDRILNPIKYIPKHGGRTANGIPAEVLGDICQVWIDASNDGILSEKHEKTAQKARILQKAVGKVGWIALVDEATGFQVDRDKQALQKLLGLYISKEYLPWTKTFMDSFYEEIYRLKGWHYNPKKNKYQVVGKYTLKYIYGAFPKPIIEAIKKKTPRDKSGNYIKKLFQNLTHEIGKPELDRILGGVTALLKASSTWRQFESNYARAYGEQKDQLRFSLNEMKEE